MIVVCPQCETSFDIPADKYRPGRKARCSNCGNIFPLPEIIDPASGERASADALDSSASSAGGLKKSQPGEAAKASVKTPDEENADDSSHDDAPDPETDEPRPPVSVEDAVLDSDTAKPVKKPAKKPVKKSGKKRLLITGACIALLLLIGAAVLVYFVFSPSAPTSALSSAPAERVGSQTTQALDGKGSGQEGEAEAARQAAVRRLVLENVRQYTVTDNPKTGRMVVIEGTVVNNFDTPKDLILLEVTIFDAKGNSVILREQYAGVTLSYIQLTTMPKAALENALNNQSDILTNNTNTPPGGRVPFMAVFFDLPGSAYEFEVKIVDAKDSIPAK